MGNSSSQREREALYLRKTELDAREAAITNRENLSRSAAVKEVESMFSHREQEWHRREERLANAESNVLPFQRSHVSQLKPGHFAGSSKTNIPCRYNIGLFGMVNAGKSSLLNSIFYAFKGEYPSAERVPVAPPHHKGRHTKRTFALRVTDHMNLIDTPGISPDDMKNGDDTFLKAIIDRFERGRLLGSIDDISSTDTNNIHSAVVVISPETAMDTREIHETLINAIENMLGCYPVAVITHADKSTPEKIESTRGFLRTRGIDDIYEIETMHQHHFEKKYQVAVLDMLMRCMYLSDRKQVLDSDNVDERGN